MSSKPDQHLYNQTQQANDRYKKMVNAALARGKSIRLHAHASGEECVGKCVTYEPDMEGDDE